MDAPDALSEAELLAAVAKGHGRDAWARRTEVNHLVDAPTEMAVAAARVVRDPDMLAAALESVLLAVRVRRVEASGGVRPGFTSARMQIADPRGGALLIEREAPPFTPG